MTESTDNDTMKMVSQNEILASDDVDTTSTESTHSSAKNGSAPRVITSISSAVAVVKSWSDADDANKTNDNDNDISRSTEGTSLTNESSSIQSEQLYGDSMISLTDEDISSEQATISSENECDGDENNTVQHRELGETSGSHRNDRNNCNSFCTDNSEGSLLVELDDPKIEEKNLRCASNDSGAGNHSTPHQEVSPEEFDSNLQSSSDSDGLVLDDNEKPAMATSILAERDCAQDISREIPRQELFSEGSSETINHAPVGLEDIDKQEFMVLLSPQDEARQIEIDSYSTEKKSFRPEHDVSEGCDPLILEHENTKEASMNKSGGDAANNERDGGNKNYADARDLWAQLSATGDQLITDTNDSGESDSESSGIESFETGDHDEGPFPFLSQKTGGKKGARTKLTSVTMDDNSIATCFSREVSMGEPSDGEEDSNQGGPCVSWIKKLNAKKKRVIVLASVALIIYGIGVLLGSMSHAYWNFYQQDDEQQQDEP